MYSTHTSFLEIRSLEIAFAAVVESFGGPTGVLLCLECGDSVVYHSWWMRLLLLSVKKAVGAYFVLPGPAFEEMDLMH